MKSQASSLLKNVKLHLSHNPQLEKTTAMAFCTPETVSCQGIQKEAQQVQESQTCGISSVGKDLAKH